MPKPSEKKNSSRTTKIHSWEDKGVIFLKGISLKVNVIGPSSVPLLNTIC